MWELLICLAVTLIAIQAMRSGFAWWERTRPPHVWGPGGRHYGRRADGTFVTSVLRRRITDPDLLAALTRSWAAQQAGHKSPFEIPLLRRGGRGGGGGDYSGWWELLLGIFRIFD